MRRRGETAFEATVFLFINMTIVLIVLFSIVVYVRKHLSVNDDITESELDVLMYSLLINPDGPTMYNDRTMRIHPGTVDLEFFSKGDDELESIFSIGEREPYYAMKVSLIESDGKPYQKNGRSVDPVYMYKDKYDVWIELARMKYRIMNPFRGPGSAIERNKMYYVNVDDDQAIMEVSIVMLRS